MADEQQPDLGALLGSPELALWAPKYYEFLRASDQKLKQLIEYLRTGHRPAGHVKGGSVEFGIIPYWVEDPPVGLPSWLLKVLTKLVPKTTITKADYEFLVEKVKAGEAVAEDGTIFGFSTYEQLDWRWAQSLSNDIATRVSSGRASFGDSPYTGSLGGATSAIKIAFMGDWGTGFGDGSSPLPAKSVIDSIVNEHDPDFIVHLGDVYYSGTPDSGLLYHPLDEERDHLVDCWPSGRPPNSCFTLNSNHEMYSGAKGYFEALGTPNFVHQQGTSYFLLQNDDWQLFGLDSAYAATDLLYMNGRLEEEEISWVQKNYDPSKKIIIATHHNGLSNSGETVESLWDDVERALNGDQPDYWYWGHIHNGIVYNGIGRTPAARNSATARCVGHGALPYGFAWGLTKPESITAAPGAHPNEDFEYIDTVEYFAHTKAGAGRLGQVKNGYLIMTLQGDAVHSEVFYDEDGTPGWSTPPTS